MPMRRFVAMRIMHRLAVELGPMIGRVFPTRRQGPMIALAIIQVMVYMTIEVIRTVEPRASADKHAA